MEQIPIAIDSLRDFEDKLISLDCRIARKSTLASLPGSIHWHIKRDGEPSGTLEMTQHEGKAWFSVHANRNQPWIDLIINNFR